MENVVGTITLPPRATGGPRSRRMGGILQVPPFTPLLPMDAKPLTPPSSPKNELPPMLPPPRTSHTPPPPPPPRSPLRPASTKSVASVNSIINMYTKRDTIATIRTDKLEPPPERKESPAPLSVLLEQLALSSPPIKPTNYSESCYSDLSLLNDKPLPVTPSDDSPLDSPTATITLENDISETSTLATLAPTAPTMTKREHALKELLTSEQAYASDLAFIRNVHIPMALGNSSPFQLPRPMTPPSSSGSSTRTLSTSSDSSSSSYLNPPMTKEDVRIIFGNITDLAVFSEMFSERLQDALGDVLEDGKGDDWVGALFLEMIPQMEEPYKTYITKHPNAIKHLAELPQTSALAYYLAQTQNLATSVTHAWDLQSLLIKPVQRLLKYSLLLTTIIDHTADSHPDKANLRKARDRMEEVARGVNEGRRRIEVIKEILNGKMDVGKSGTLTKKLSLSKNPQLGVSRMKSIGASLRADRLRSDNSEESRLVDRYEKELRTCNTFIRTLASDIVHWAETVRDSQEHLKEWALGFGKTIGINHKQPSEAYDAFLDIINIRLLPLCQDLHDIVGQELLPQLGGLLDTTRAPQRLLSAMHALEPLHHSLLNLNYSKHRPNTTILEASQNYLALRGQLASDLPKYLELLDRGIVMCIRHFARRQTDFWSFVRDQWGALWECLRMEGETNAGCEETLTLWWSRYSEVEEVISKLNILKREKGYHRAARSWTTGHATSYPNLASMDSPFPYMAASPDSSSFSVSTTRHRSYGSLDATNYRPIHRTPSTESFPNSFDGRSRPRTPESLGRSKSRSITSPYPISSSVPSASTYIPYHATVDITASPSQSYAESIDSRTEIRGRKSRSSSLSQKISDTLRAPLRRSPSQKSVSSIRSERRTGVATTTDWPVAAVAPDRPDHRQVFAPSPSVRTTNLGNAPFVPVQDARDIRHLVKTPPNSPSDYRVVVVHECNPPDGAIYEGLRFLRLRVRQVYTVLSELGHPSTIRDLQCITIGEGERDCLLVVKAKDGEVGLALASFMLPCDS